MCVFFLGSQVSQVVRQTTPRLLVGPASRDQLSSTRWNLSVTVVSGVMSSASVLEHGEACCHFAAREVSKNSHGFWFLCISTYIWVNFDISLTMIPVRSQWGRYNLPRCIWWRESKWIHNLINGPGDLLDLTLIQTSAFSIVNPNSIRFKAKVKENRRITLTLNVHWQIEA